MNMVYVISGFLAFGLMVYLFVALFRAEWFQ